MARKFLGLALVAVIVFGIYIALTSATIFTSQASISLGNTTNGTGYSFSIHAGTPVSSATFVWNGTAQPQGSPDGLSNPTTARQLHSTGSLRFMMMGQIDLNFPPPEVPAQPSYIYSKVPIYGSGDGFAFYFTNASGIYFGLLKVLSIQHSNTDAQGDNITIAYKMNLIPNNRTMSAGFDSGGGGGLAGCAINTDSAQCSRFPGCYWDSTQCKTADFSGGGGGGFTHVTTCDFFRNNVLACTNITACVYDGTSGSCANNQTTFNLTTGLRCQDIRPNATICTNIKEITPLCSQNISAGGNCTANYSKSFSDVQAPVQFCEGAQNQTSCNQLINDFGMPCKFDTESNRCTVRLENIFTGDVKRMFDISTEQSCSSTGGNWKQENYQSTNSYGQAVIQSKGWCEPSFGFNGGSTGSGFAKKSCDDACWACDRNSTISWPNASVARTQCDNSKIGICKWVNNSFAQNSFGWCQPDPSVSFGLAGSGNKTCFGNIKNSTCMTSAANCTWIIDPFLFDANNDGSFDNTTDGSCITKGAGNKMDCNQNCNACQTSSACVASAVTNGCSWNTTLSGRAIDFSLCVPNGVPREICFLPGDEDANGQADCLDTSCSSDPFCGFGSTGNGTVRSAIDGVGFGSINPAVCAQWANNQTQCMSQTGPGGTPLATQPVCMFTPRPDNFMGFPTVGICKSTFDQNIGGGMQFEKPPTIIGIDAPNDAGANPHLDILGVGIHEAPGKADKFDIGLSLTNLSNAGWCNQYYPSSQNLTAGYYRYLDVDENTTNSCGLDSNSSSLGWEFKLRAVSSNITTNMTSFRCLNSTWVPYGAQIRQMGDMCQLPEFMPAEAGGGVQILLINKMDIGNPKKYLRLYVATANGTATSNETNPVDVAGPFYYTSGSIDKKFENCAVPGGDEDNDGITSENDPDCQMYLKFGSNPSEGGPMCRDGRDNDADGKTDCSDAECKYDPFSGCGFATIAGALTCDPADKNSPSLKWLDVKTFPTYAFVKYDSDEAANGTLSFYRTDSNCATLNATIRDSALRNQFSGDDYRPFHDARLDVAALNYTLSVNTTYYYKFQMVDICNNKLSSACLNFTTTSNFSSFVIRPVPLNGSVLIDIPEIGVSNNNFTYGIQTNASAAKDVTLRIKDTTSGFTIELINVTLFSAISMNISTIFNTSGDKHVGMNTSNWDKMLTDLSPKQVNITIPDNGSEIFKCEEANLSNCVNVTAVAQCVFRATNTTCAVPIGSGLGFSSYKVTGTLSAATTTSTDTSTTTSSGGGGGGAGTTKSKKTAYSTKDDSVPAGKGLKDNLKLAAALEKVLAKGQLSEEAKSNLLDLSAVISATTSVERSIEVAGGKSTVTAKFKNNNPKNVKNFAVYEKLPKSFANSTDDVIVTVSSGTTVEIVEKDPEYLVTFANAFSGQEMTVSYEVNKSVSTTVIDDMSTEVYGEALEDAAVTEAPETPTETPVAEEPKAPEPATTLPASKPFQLTAEMLYVVAGAVVIVAVIIVVSMSRKKKR